MLIGMWDLYEAITAARSAYANLSFQIVVWTIDVVQEFPDLVHLI